MPPNRRNRIETLLGELTQWRRMSGPVMEPGSDFASTGESAAAIADLEAKLAALGARYSWSESSREYRLDSIESPEQDG